MRELCGNCKYNKCVFEKNRKEFCCGNANSENYGSPTAYNDTCDDWDEKE